MIILKRLPGLPVITLNSVMEDVVCLTVDQLGYRSLVSRTALSVDKTIKRRHIWRHVKQKSE